LTGSKAGAAWRGSSPVARPAGPERGHEMSLRARVDRLSARIGRRTIAVWVLPDGVPIDAFGLAEHGRPIERFPTWRGFLFVLRVPPEATHDNYFELLTPAQRTILARVAEPLVLLWPAGKDAPKACDPESTGRAHGIAHRDQSRYPRPGRRPSPRPAAGGGGVSDRKPHPESAGPVSLAEGKSPEIASSIASRTYRAPRVWPGRSRRWGSSPRSPSTGTET
jgi:hypothetical protein